MKGFFVERSNPHAVSNSTTNKSSKKPTCLTCGLKKKCKNKRIPPIGNLNGNVLIVFGSVTSREDHKGSLLLEGQLARIKRCLAQNGIPWSDCALTRAVRCCSESPTDKEVISCSEHLYSTIENGQFSNVILIGEQAVTCFFSYQSGNEFATLSKLRGLTVPDLRFNLYVSVISEPVEETDSSFGEDVMRNTLFLRDMEAMSEYYKKKVPEEYSRYKEYLFPCTSSEAVQVMKKILEGDYRNYIAFDFETTGLRPYNNGHRILSCAIATNEHASYSFMITEKTAFWLKKILRSPHIPKVAANMKFEKTWAKQILNCTVNNLILDVVVAAHVIDNRTGVTGVKFQSFQNFGIYGYEKAVANYISATKEDEDLLGANAFNSMHKCPEETMLTYVAMDSLLEYWISLKQIRKVL